MLYCNCTKLKKDIHIYVLIASKLTSIQEQIARPMQMMHEKIQIELLFKAFCRMKATDHLSLHYFPIPSAVALCNALMYYLCYLYYIHMNYALCNVLCPISKITNLHVYIIQKQYSISVVDKKKIGFRSLLAAADTTYLKFKCLLLLLLQPSNDAIHISVQP